MSARHVLLTRPKADSAALAGKVAALGWEPLIWPLLDIVPTGAAADTSGVRTVLLTSANAARALPATRLDPLPPQCLCVGAATASAAKAAGYRGIEEADGDAESLVRLVLDRLSPGAGPLLFLRGAEVAADLAQLLRARGFDVRETVVYDAVAATTVPSAVADAIEAGALDAALFFSPRTARIFAEAAQPWRACLGQATAVAISRKAAAPLAECGFGTISTAATPDEPAMLAALGAASRGLDHNRSPRYDTVNGKEAEP